MEQLFYNLLHTSIWDIKIIILIVHYTTILVLNVSYTLHLYFNSYDTRQRVWYLLKNTTQPPYILYITGSSLSYDLSWKKTTGSLLKHASKRLGVFRRFQFFLNNTPYICSEKGFYLLWKEYAIYGRAG